MDHRAREAAAAAPGIYVDLLVAAVERDGVRVTLGAVETALVIALAVSRRPLASEELIDRLYPDVDAAAARNALRVLVHRVRRRLGAAVIVNHRGGYTLGADVGGELEDLERLVRHAAMPLAAEDRDRIERAVARLGAGLPAFAARYEWFAALERRLVARERDAAFVLARDAQHHRRYDEARELCAAIVVRDELDEDATELAVRASLAAGRAEAARRIACRYVKAVEREGEPLAPRMRELIAAVANAQRSA